MMRQESYKYEAAGEPGRASGWHGPMAWAALGVRKTPAGRPTTFQKPLPFSTFLYFILLYSTFDGASIGLISRS